MPSRPEDILDPLNIPQAVKRDAFNAFYDAPDSAGFQSRFDTLPLPKEAKRDLWDLRFGPNAMPQFGVSQNPPRATTQNPTLPENMPQEMAKWLPMIGATAGSMLAPEIPALGIASKFIPGLVGSMVGGGTGEAAKEGIEKLTGEPTAPQSFQEFASGVGKEAALQGAYHTVGSVVNGTLSKMFGRYLNPQQLYQSGLKPVKKIEMEKAIGAGLQENIPLSYEGRQKAGALWRDLNKQIETVISADPDKPVDLMKVLGVLDRVRAKWRMRPEFVASINDFERQMILDHAGLPTTISGPHGQKIATDTLSLKGLRNLAHGKSITGANAQELKKELWEGIRMKSERSFAEGAHPGLTIRSEHAIASALADELRNLYPQLSSLNAREAGVIELEKALRDFVKREGNKQITPHFVPLLAAMAGGGGGYAMGGERGAAIGAAGPLLVLGTNLVRSAIEDPAVKSRLAILLYHAGKGVPGVVSNVAKKMAPYIVPTGIRAGAAAMQSPIEIPSPPVLNPEK